MNDNLMSKLDLIFLHAPSVYDFRRESIMYGPVSELVPSTPVFEMYPIGFTTMAEYLERHGMRTRIVNLAVRMLESVTFDVEKYIASLDAMAFGIDLHWLPHAHGSVEIARLVKKLHPKRPVIFGGFSSTYFHEELIRYPAVDFILRGDSTEFPLLLLTQFLRSGGETHPAFGSPAYRKLSQIPNLVWKDAENQVQVNPLTYSPEDLDDLMLDYSGIVRSVVRYRDLASVIPFRGWVKYPITAALPVRGCRYNCVTCGGSSCTFRSIHNRQKPAYRSPEKLAQDVRRMGEFSNAPVFVLSDIRMAGEDYAYRFLDALGEYNKPIMFELFREASPEFYRRMAATLKNFTIEISMESHDEMVRRAFGRPYTNQELEKTIDDALNAGANRFDLFFMVGIKGQTYESVMGTVDYCRGLLQRYAGRGDNRVLPFISPMAPFLDPGSQAFEEPEKHGYRLSARTLEEHRQHLLAPSWKYVLNYETIWMNRDQIVAATYESGRRMNLLKGEFGVIDAETADKTDQRIARAVTLMGEIDRIIATTSEGAERARLLNDLKRHVDEANLSTVCDKSELEVPVRGMRLNLVQAAALVVNDWWRNRLSG
jgi:B12-binding domain/radical SAM domain protein